MGFLKYLVSNFLVLDYFSTKKTAKMLEIPFLTKNKLNIFDETKFPNEIIASVFLNACQKMMFLLGSKILDPL